MQEGDRVNNIWHKKHQERFKGNKIKNIENVKNAKRKRRRKEEKEEEKKYRERAEKTIIGTKDAREIKKNEI